MAYSTVSWEKYLSPQEAGAYGQLFKTVSKATPGIVTGTEAVQFFATSGVPNPILSDIWETADRDNHGYLTPETFSIALKLIACAQHGTEVADPIISTTVPLPQFKGLEKSVVSPPIAPATASAVITPTEREKYITIFRAQQPKNGQLDGAAARNVFIKSKLSNDILGQIWALADVRGSGALNQTEFTIAMHYIAKLMEGSLTNVPAQLPAAVYASAAGTSSTPLLSHQPSPLAPQLTGNSTSSFNRIMTPPQRAATIDSLGNLAFSNNDTTTSFSSVASQPRAWDVTPSEKTQYDSYFDKIDTQRLGFVQGKEAVEFFKNSGLQDRELAHIWDLADTSQRGRLSREEFAVAMHLIHKRLRGDPLPTVLPATLAPPTSTNEPTFISSPMALPQPNPAFPPHQPQDPFNPPGKEGSLLDEDLLGDFGNNDQLPQVTNQVNQLQNQIQSTHRAMADVKQQKISAEQSLEQLGKQKEELQTALTQVKLAHDTELKELTELQETVQREEPAWQQAQREFEAAQKQLSQARHDIQQLKQRIDASRQQSEQYRQQVHTIQHETQALLAQIDQLNGDVKHQTTMADVHRRQVTAAEQDRQQAQRNLADAKEVQGMTESAKGLGLHTNSPFQSTPQNDNNDDTSSDDDTPFQRPSLAASTAAASSSPPAPASAWPDSPFGPPPATNLPPSDTKPNFFDVFSPHLSQAESPATPKTPQPPAAPASAPAASPNDDFDTVFGDLAGIPSPDEQPASSPFSPFQVPPTESDPFASTPTTAPAPAPATTASTATASAFDDDFDAAFSGLSDAKQATPAQGDMDDIDAAFGIFDKSATDTPQTHQDPSTWATSFDGIQQPKGKAPASDKPADDWDSIFGGAPASSAASPTTASANPTEPFGFDDAFSSADVPTPDVKAAVAKAGESDKVDELVKMGFDRSVAKDALNRYDQDVTKATNYLLDQPN
ncbi:hypothetical protein DM01DRAFT_1340240 [Hesseltinella vesiculosa]|uniref:EF-hand n=1 Tax=Hesseltinella vesiculosa TaxID=101127 RepID=A0A1X2G4Q8_9FUNG|nr:hypothetical protein DM01DRAFT_1340240 [Hesseltinella vesiculosa]